MPVTTSTSTATFDTTAIEKGASAYLQANGITTQGAWNTYVNALTDAQVATLMRALLKAMISVG